MKTLALIAMLFALPANACPVVEDTTGEKDAILDRLAAATDFSTSQKAHHAIWVYWQTAPDAQAQDWLDEGLARIRQTDFERAKAALTALVDYCPEYAEGYNQLAFAQFLAGEYAESADNLRKTIALEPRHFGAYSGMGLIDYQQGNIPAAKIWIKKAVAIYPNLNERFILDIVEDGDEL